MDIQFHLVGLLLEMKHHLHYCWLVFLFENDQWDVVASPRQDISTLHIFVSEVDTVGFDF